MKRSKIWNKFSTSELYEIVKSSNTLAEILRHFDFENIGSNYKTLKARLDEENIDYSCEQECYEKY